MKTNAVYPKEVVEERISFYKTRILYLEKNNATEKIIDTSKKLLAFWTNYKNKNY